MIDIKSKYVVYVLKIFFSLSTFSTYTGETPTFLRHKTNSSCHQWLRGWNKS